METARRDETGRWGVSEPAVNAEQQAMDNADQKDVRSGTSFWRAVGSPPVSCPPLDEHISCEVAVIGSGITGALLGYSLSRAGVEVVLIDKGEVGAGSTAASTGLLQYEIDTPLRQLIAHVGENHATRAYRCGLRAIDELEELVANLASPCGFQRRSTLCLASSEQDLKALEQEHECRRHFGFDVNWLSSGRLRELWDFSAPGALHSTGDAEIDPYRFTQDILRGARVNGLRAFGSTQLQQVRETASGVELTCDHGKIVAGSVVFCTGYFLQPWFPSNLATLHTTFAACSQPLAPIPAWSDRCLIWETARPYFYARQTSDGRAMIGGGDTPFADDHESGRLLATKGWQLKRQFEQLFGTVFTPEFLWAGTFAETRDGLPFIGRVPGQEEIYSALGYGGNGITFSTIAARLITDLILTRANDDVEIFRFER